MGTNKSKEYLQGVPELLILRLLQDREMYGYEIVKGIRSGSGDAISFGEGVIYPMLHGLQKRRLLAIRRTTVNGRPRIYYRLTRAGQRRLEQKITDWHRIADAIQTLLDKAKSEPERTQRAPVRVAATGLLVPVHPASGR